MEQLDALLRDLAAKLGTTVEHLWSVLVKQAFFASIAELVFIVAVCVFCFLYAKGIKYTYKNWEEIAERDLEVLPVVFIIIGALSVMFMIISAFISVETMLAGFFNPEYYALQKVLNLIK